MENENLFDSLHGQVYDMAVHVMNNFDDSFKKRKEELSKVLSHYIYNHDTPWLRDLACKVSKIFYDATDKALAKYVFELSTSYDYILRHNLEEDK